METHTFKIPSIDEVDFQLIPHPEDIPVQGNCPTTGDPDIDRKIVTDIVAEICRGNVWGWACVEVKVLYKGFTESDYLGGCNYQDESDFVKNSGFYEEMKKTAYNRLIEQFRAL